MSQNEFIKNEVAKIVAEYKAEYPKNVALASAWILANFKGINLKIFDVKETSSLADYYVIGSATNTTQARAMTDELQVNLKQSGLEILSTEGLTDAEWILVDAGDIMVHIFNENSREIFDLDHLWAKYDQIEIPQSYYFAGHDNPDTKTSDSTDNYF